MMTSSNDTMKAKIAAEMTPGRMIGRVTRQKVRSRLAPKFMAACSRLGSTPCSVADTMTTTTGMASTVWASARPASVPVSSQRAKRK